MPQEFVFPSHCAKCLGAPDRRIEFGVPVCAACLGRASAYRRRGRALLVASVALGVVASAVVWMLTRSLGAAWLAAIGLTVGVVLHTLDSWRAGFFGVEGGVPFFENPEYQRLFEDANGLERADYGSATQQFLETEGREPRSGGDL